MQHAKQLYNTGYLSKVGLFKSFGHFYESFDENFRISLSSKLYIHRHNVLQSCSALKVVPTRLYIASWQNLNLTLENLLFDSEMQFMCVDMYVTR